MHDLLSVFYTFPHWLLVFPLVGLGTYLSTASDGPLRATWDRLAYLTGRLMLFTAILYIPLIFYTGTWHHYNTTKALSLEYMVLIILASWWAVKGRLRRPHSPMLLPAAYFFLIMVLTTFVAVNMAEAWETLLLYGAALVFMVLIGAFIRRPDDIRLVCIVMNITVLLVVLYALAQWFDWEPLWRAVEGPNLTGFTRKPVSFMGNENYAGEFLNLTFPLAITLLIWSWGNPAWMVMFSGIACLSMIAILYIDCNASYMGFLVGFPVMVLILISYRVLPWLHDTGLLNTARRKVTLKEMRFWFRRLVFALILGVALVSALTASVDNPLRSRVAQLITWADFDGDHLPDGVPPMIFRLECMSSALKTTHDNVFTGIGPGNFKVIHPYYESQLERKILGKETLARKVHNDFLYHSAEHGFFGMLGWIWMWVTALWCAFRSLPVLDWTNRKKVSVGPPNQPFSLEERRFLFYFQVGAIGGMIIALISCNFGHTFVIPASLFLFWFIAGSSVLIYQWTQGEGTVCKPRQKSGPHFLTRLSSTVRWPVLLVIVLIIGSLNVRQLIGESHLRVGMTKREYDQFGEMFNHFDKAMEIWPYQMEIFYILGRYCIDAFQKMEDIRRGVENQVNEILASGEVTPEQEKLLRQQADQIVQQQLAQHGLDEKERMEVVDLGIRVLQTDVYLNPIYKWAHNNLGVLYDKRAAFTHSERSYDRVLDIDYEQVYAHYNHGLGYLREHQYEKARRSFEQALVADPTKTEVLQYLGHAYYNMGDLEHAKQAYDHYTYKTWDEKGLPWSPDPQTQENLFKVYFNLGVQLSQENKPQQALDSLIRAASTGYQKMTPQESRLLKEQIASNLVKLNRVNEAIEVYREMLAKEDMDNTTRRNLVLLLSHIGRNEEALEAMQRVAKDEPHDWSAWYNIATLKARVGNYSEESILSDLKKAIELDRQQVVAQLSEDQLLREALKGTPFLEGLLGDELHMEVQK